MSRFFRILSTLLAGTMVLALGACASAPAGKSLRHDSYETYKPPVLSGLDILARDGFGMFEGQRVGIVTNHSGLTRDGEHIIDVFVENGVDVAALFSPEHGIRGEVDTAVSDEIDEKTGLTIHSLYGRTRRPSPEMLEGLDTIVFDIQDIGARFYTYIGTMANVMEVAKDQGIHFVVLDRPNPIRGDWFDGPIQDPDLVGNFTAIRPMPIAHGMTVGELAHYFNKYSGRFADGPGIGIGLTVVPMEGWKRSMYYDQTGLPWVNPSPNMRSLEEELLYTMVALTEGNKIISVGRGTDRPFEYLGAPWVDGEALTKAFRDRNIPGLWIMQETFIPRKIDVSGRENINYQFIDEVCNGVRFVLVDRDAFNPVVAGIHKLDILNRIPDSPYTLQGVRGN
ncbi:MAG: DUF1343 domain-containing protein, partial [Candidatus Sumerlaeia bacterium]|nr:DUF1343 domain-containing protein [Candidatus Sumerlaeia bacterium]